MAKTPPNNPLTAFLPNFIVEHLGIYDKLRDHIAIDTPSKGGELKVYFDSSDMADAEIRIKNAVELRCFMYNELEKCAACRNQNIKSKQE